ncbi:Elongation factor Ts, mitochondrial [Naganishia albida]|nr:Elongation factor Ts, mitochondrial [Naganishia albida]
MHNPTRLLQRSATTLRHVRPTTQLKPLSTSSRLHNVKVPITLIAELRKQNPISLSKAREALAASNLSVSAALEWLEKDLEASGAKKVAKVGSRTTKEGLIGVTVMGTRASMVELRCETDFVAKNEIFRTLAENICSTAAFLDLAPPSGGDPVTSFPTEELLHAPVIPLDPSAGLLSSSSSAHATPTPQNISQAITSAITQTGENIQLSRACSFSSPIPDDRSQTQPFLLPGAYVHGAVKPGGNEGKVGALIVLSTISTAKSSPIMERVANEPSLGGDLQKMARAVARQVVGFPTKAVSKDEASGPPVVLEEGEVSPFLLEQPFMMYQGEQRTVKEVLEEWAAERNVKVSVAAIRRWTVGEDA